MDEPEALRRAYAQIDHLCEERDQALSACSQLAQDLDRALRQRSSAEEENRELRRTLAALRQQLASPRPSEADAVHIELKQRIAQLEEELSHTRTLLDRASAARDEARRQRDDVLATCRESEAALRHARQLLVDQEETAQRLATENCQLFQANQQLAEFIEACSSLRGTTTP